MILEILSAVCLAAAMIAAVLITDLQAFIAVIGFTALGILIVYIAVKGYERKNK